MTDQEAEFIWNNLMVMFGDRVPHPEREPRRFRYYINIYKHLVKLHGEQHGI
jgi:hypothetical protein